MEQLDNYQLPMSLASIPAQGDPRIAMGVRPPVNVDPLGETSRAYTLADQMDKRQHEQQAQADQAILQEALQSGADMQTPDGIKNLAASLKGKVHPDTYASLVKMSQTASDNALKTQEGLVKLDDQKFGLVQKQTDFVLKGLSSLSTEYENDVSQKGVPGALEEFEKKKQAVIQAMAQSKVVPDNVLKDLSQLTPTQLKAKLEQTGFYQNMLDKAALRRKEEAEAKKADAMAQMYQSGGKEVAMLEAVRQRYGEDSPEYKAALQRMSGRGSGAAAGTPGLGAGGDLSKRGDEYLATLPEAEAEVVKAVAEGRVDLNKLAARQGNRDRITAEVNHYKNDFDTKTYPTKLAAEKAWTTGKQGDALRFFGNSLRHLDQMEDLSKKLNNKDMQGANKVLNAIATEFGKPEVTNFNAAKTIVADEVVKAIMGTGNAGAESDRVAAQKIFDAVQSPEQIAGAIKQVRGLLKGQLTGMRNQYKSGTGKSDFYDRFSIQDQFRETESQGKGNTDKDDQVAILQGEVKKIKDRLSQAQTPEDEHRAQQDLAAVTRELKKLGVDVPDAAPATAKAAPAKKVDPSKLPPKNAKGWELHVDAKGNAAYVSPDRKQFEEAK